MSVSKLRLVSIAAAVIATLSVATAQTDSDNRAKRGVKVKADKGKGSPSERSIDGGLRYHALLIGIKEYQEPHTKLVTPINDITNLKLLLEERYGYRHIEVLQDAAATKAAILDALRKFDSLGENDSLLIYYAGHGHENPRTKLGYWIPVDARGHDELSYLSNDELKSLLKQIPAQKILLVSDSCYSGAMLSRDSGIKEEIAERLAATKSYEFIASGSDEPVADGGRDKMSAFAFYFTQALEQNEQPWLTSGTLFSRVFGPVSGLAGQVPVMGLIQGMEHDIGGQFLFQLAEGGGSNPPPPPEEDGVPAGWRLPEGYEARKVDGTDNEFTYHSTGADRAEMVLVLPGTFPFRGKEEARIATPFLMDLHEVTVARFGKFLRESGTPTDNLKLQFWGQKGYSDQEQPMVGIDLATARAFAKWAGKQLPTEIEWEYAAGWDPKKGALRKFPWGSTFDEASVPGRMLSPPTVGSCPIDFSPWGARGLGSGVSEWCVLPMGDARRQTWGVVRGASQVPLSPRRPLNKRPLTFAKERRGDTSAKNIGFRCTVSLVR